MSKNKYEDFVDSIKVETKNYSTKVTWTVPVSESPEMRMPYLKKRLRQAKSQRRRYYKTAQRKIRTQGLRQDISEYHSEIKSLNKLITELQGDKDSRIHWWQWRLRALTAERELAKMTEVSEKFAKLSDLMDVDAFISLAEQRDKDKNLAEVIDDLEDLELEE